MKKQILYILIGTIFLLNGCAEPKLTWGQVRGQFNVDKSKTEIPRNKKGQKHGLVKTYYKMGALEKVSTYVNGQKQGVEKQYCSAYNKTYYLMRVVRDRKPTLSKNTFATAIYLCSTVNYVDGKKEGYQKHYAYPNKGSKLIGKDFYKNGYLVSGPSAVNAANKKKFYDDMRALEGERNKWMKKYERTRKTTTTAISLNCTSSGSLSISEMSSKTAIGRGKGEGAALGYMMNNGNPTSVSRNIANHYCITNANYGAYDCVVANSYVQGCMSKLGH